MTGFALFAGDVYYPSGGWEDCKGTFDTLYLAIAAHVPETLEWAHVVNLSTGTIVYKTLQSGSKMVAVNPSGLPESKGEKK